MDNQDVLQQAVERLGLTNDATALLEERTVWTVIQEAYEGKGGDVQELQQILLAQVRVNVAMAVSLVGAMSCLKAVKNDPFKRAIGAGDIVLTVAKEALRVSARDMAETVPIQDTTPLEGFDVGAAIDRTLKELDEIMKGRRPNDQA